MRNFLENLEQLMESPTGLTGHPRGTLVSFQNYKGFSVTFSKILVAI